MADIEIKHIRSQNYLSGMATGMMLMGPTPDGFVHVTFFRDGIITGAEVFEGDEAEGTFDAAKRKPSMGSLCREDIATMIIPEERLAAFRKALDLRLAPGDESAVKPEAKP